MSISTEITRITQAKGAIITAIEGKGTQVPGGAKIDQLPALITAIQSGTNTNDATATAERILSGYTAYAQGAKLTGTMPSYTGATSLTVGTAAQTIQTAGNYLPSNLTLNRTYRYTGTSGSGSLNSSGQITVNTGFNLYLLAGYVSTSTGYQLAYYWWSGSYINMTNSSGAITTNSSIAINGTTNFTATFRNNSSNAITGTCYYYAYGYYS